MWNHQKSYFGGSAPFAVTEQGVVMLSGVLKSKKALQTNIAIMRTFVEVRKLAVAQGGFSDLLQNLRAALRERISGHDSQLKHIYDAIEDLLDKEAEKIVDRENCKKRERIGFKK